MNGRVYDPFLARFLSPDPQLQSPDYSQNYNRYSYAWNNPLKYTDPSGEFIHLVIGAAIGGVFNWLANGAQFNAAGLGHFGVGALAGGLGAGIGAGFGALASGAGHFSFMSSAALGAQGFGAGAAVGFGTGFTGGMVTGTGNSLIQGENIGKALSNGLNSALWGGTLGGLTGGISGGIRAARAGNNFWSGNPAGGKYGGVPQVLERGLNYSFESSLNIGQSGPANIDQMTNPDRYYLKVERFMETDKSTISRFSFPDGTNGYFLEPPGPSSIVEGSGLRIMPGAYEVVPYSSSKYPNALQLVGVPGRAKILSHIGNFPLDTEGCLLPGLSYANDFVGYSGDASGKLLDLFSSKSRFVINIY
ncbi:MAG: DUF5675 family protein, partial [Bacteroidales bacterium]|nr:DUF5675 family protein [Bacteroidales bacterium]